MATLLELRNEARDLLGKAKKAYEDKDIQAGDALWEQYTAKDKEADEEQGREDRLKAAHDKYDAPPAEDMRDPHDAAIKGVKPEDAKEGVMIKAEGGGYEVVPFADEKTEGWIKGYPVSVQHPHIIRRLTPKLAEEAKAQVDAFWQYCRFGKGSLSGDQHKVLEMLRDRKALQEGTDSEGGYLVPTDAVRLPPIMARGVGGGRMRPICSQFTTTRDGGDWPTTTDDVTWAAVGEEAGGDESDPTIGQVTFTIRKFGRLNKVSEELLADSAVDVAALLGGCFMRGLGRFEDEQGIGGDGTTEPLGIRTTGAAQGDVSDSVADYNASTAPDWADVVEHYFALPEQWRDNLTWFTTSSFLRHLVAIVGAGVPRVVEFMGDPVRPVILGRPVVMFDGTGWDDAAAIAVNEEFGCVGDFSQYFFITRVGMTITRLNERFADTDQVGFKARVRYDSFFAENDAFRIMKAAAA